MRHGRTSEEKIIRSRPNLMQKAYRDVPLQDKAIKIGSQKMNVRFFFKRGCPFQTLTRKKTKILKK
jgi:hypothetical protein